MKRPFKIFLAFMIAVGFLVAGSLAFIQSPQFARIFKSFAAKYIPADLGVEADFSDFSVNLFPPALSLNEPKIRLHERNILKLPGGSRVQAKRIMLAFRPFQMLSGDIRVQRVSIVDGDVNLVLPALSAKAKEKSSAKGKRGKISFHWEDLLQVRAEALSIEKTRMHMTWSEGGEGGSHRVERSADFIARSVQIEQSALFAESAAKEGSPAEKVEASGGYRVELEVEDPSGSWIEEAPFLRSVKNVSARAQVSSQGLQVEFLRVTAEELSAQVSGRVKGDVLNPKDLQLDAEARLIGDLRKTTQWLAPPEKGSQKKSTKKSALVLEGTALFSGRVKGNLTRPMETLKAEGSLEVNNFKFQDWHADQVLLEGGWTASSSGGEISLARAIISEQERERVGGSQPGRGGKVEIGPLRVGIAELSRFPALSAPIKVPVRLDRAHLHWLAAPGVKAVYPLIFRASGAADLTFVKSNSWALAADVDLKLTDFQLDNQKLGQERPLSRVLGTPVLTLVGGISIDSGGLRPNGVVLSMSKTQLKVGGKIDFKNSTYDLFGSGPTNLSDLGKIAETEIRGEGAVGVHVHGPSKAVLVDIDADLQDASYINLELGRLQGRVTWADGPGHLLLSGMRLKQGKTSYSADGLIDLDVSGKESISLQAQIHSGDVQDLITIFSRMTRDLWWFPKGLSGPVAGEIQVAGGLNLKKLEILGRLNGRYWENWGERIENVSATGGFDKGRYQVSDFKAAKHGGKISGRISYDTEGSGEFDWDLKTENLKISDIDRVARLDVPIRGRLSVASTGKGKGESIRSRTQFSATEVSVRGGGLPPSELILETGSGKLEARGTALGGQGLLDLSYNFREGETSSLRAEAKSLDFSPFLLLINPALIQDPELTGKVSGLADLKFRSGKVERSSGKIDISEYVLAKKGARFQLIQPVSLALSDGSFDLRGASVAGDEGITTLRLRSRNADLEGTVTGELDLSMIEFFTSAVPRASGAAKIDLLLGGSLKDLKVSGRTTLEGGSLWVAAVESPFENLGGTVQIQQNKLAFRSIVADLAGGRVNADGNVTLFSDRFPQIAIQSQISGSKLKVYPFQFVKVRGNLGVHGDQLPYLVEGAVAVESALSTEKILQQKQGPGLKVAQYSPPPTPRRLTDYPVFKLKIDARAENGVVIRNELFDAEAKGHVTVVNTIEAPRIVGSADLIQGKIIFKDRVFQIQSANALFDNPTVINPRFSLSANADVGGVKVNLYASGKMDKWKVELNSTPPMPEPEIISLLALGMTSSESKKLSSSDRTAFERGEAASLLLHSLDFNREVESKTGFQIQLDESVNSQEGSSIFRPSTQAETTAAPKIVIKRKITKQLDVSYGSTVGAGSGSQQEVNAEVKVTPGFSVIGVYDTYQTTDTQGKQTSFGLDLKVQKRFK